MLSHHYVLTGAEARSYLKKSLESTFAFAERIRKYLTETGGDQETVVKRISRRTTRTRAPFQQAERPYLIKPLRQGEGRGGEQIGRERKTTRKESEVYETS